ncbi:TRAP transporter small permease subunit [Rhodobacteraceae bacterium CCMM004]|nr:TRAP transporter small permease subunit [Rhodobacteraceae bacterium CCMM004]
MATRQGQRWWAARWEEVLAGLSLIVVVCSVGYGIVSRLTPYSATWTVELATLSFTWAVFFGAAAAFRRGQHVRIDVLVVRLPEGPRRIIAIAIDLLILGFLIYVLYYAALLTVSSSARPSPILRIPFTFVYGAVLISLASMLVHQVLFLLQRVGLKKAVAE